MNFVSLDEMVQIENDPAFLEFRCTKTNYLIWPLVRTQFFRQLISDLYYKEAPMFSSAPSVHYRKAAGVLSKAVLHNFWRRDVQCEVLVFGTGAGQIQRAGLGFNRISDYFVEATSRNVSTMEGIIDWGIPEPRWNKKVNYWLPWQATILLMGRACSRDVHVRQAREVLEYATNRALSLLGISVSDEKIQMLSGVVARKIARLPIMDFAYRNMLAKFKPRLLLLEEGCYSDHGILNYIAREMGVRVAEHQHGMISRGHDAYNYAPLLRESQVYRQYLPHDFLGYGQWWIDQINAPVNKWVIGHPHYSEKIRSMALSADNKRDILILGDGIEFTLYLALAEQLDGYLKGRYRVVLRPHPLERSKVHGMFPSGTAGNVTIDFNTDIYESFGNAYVVAGEVSTGLFEAMGIVQKVLLWKTPKARFSYPEHPFIGFDHAQDLAKAVLASDESSPDVVQDKVWASEWRTNYLNYLKKTLG